MTAEDQIEPLVRLGRRIRDESKGIGLEMVRFYVGPSLDGGPHSATAMFFIDEEEPENKVLASEPDPEFDKMIENQRATEQERKEEETRQRLEEMKRKLTDPSKGILDDE